MMIDSGTYVFAAVTKSILILTFILRTIENSLTIGMTQGEYKQKKNEHSTNPRNACQTYTAAVQQSMVTVDTKQQR